MKKIKFLSVNLILILLTTANVFGEDKSSDSSSKPLFVIAGTNNRNGLPNNDAFQKIYKSHELEKEGDQLVKNHLYDEAIKKYEEAMAPALLNDEYESSTARGRIMNVHILQGKYEEALHELQWFLNLNPTKNDFIDQKAELLALIKSRDMRSPAPIYAHIQYLENKYKKYIPPTGFDIAYSGIVLGNIFRLYDVIGDADNGIALIDKVMSHPKTDKKAKKALREIKHGFEENRKSGSRGGAIQALIQNDYFVW